MLSDMRAHLIMAAMVTACGTPSLTVSDGGGGAGGRGGGSGTGGGMASGVSFQRDVVPIFNRCGTGNVSCHQRIAYAADGDAGCRGLLALENVPLGARYCGLDGCRDTGCPDRTLYQRLLELEPWSCSGAKRYVVPFDAGASLLHEVLGTDPSMNGACRDAMGTPLVRMPKDRITMSSAPPLPAAEVATLREWIAAGAPNN